ncbi:MAG: cytidine deaminase [Marinilabiliales bacterium]|nr:MAG: cytidine deaminase [Marinilabiliales bacterium]
MKEKIISVRLFEFDSEDELSSSESNLLNHAKKACTNAYAPYSQFRVGAALLLENGEVITGSNQENTSYPNGICAERVAIFTAKNKYPDIAIKSIAITANTNNFEIEEPISPCGACRQVIAETESRQHKEIKIIMKGNKGPVLLTNGIKNLLPLMFHEEKLKK